MSVPKLLARLDDLLQRRRPAYYATLCSPALASDLAAFEAEFHLPLPPELRAWFTWHNGQRGFGTFSPEGCLLSLAQAAEAMRLNCQLLADGDFVPNWWRPAWLPLLDQGSNDYLCVDLEGTFTGQLGQLVEHWHDWEMRTVTFPHFAAWLAAVVQAYEQAPAGPLSDEQVADWELTPPPGFPQEFTAG